MVIRPADEKDTTALEDAFVGALGVMAGLPERWTEAEHCAFVRDSDGLRLTVIHANVGARRFYERHGFRLTGLGDGSNTPDGAPEALYAWRPGAVAERPPA